MFTLDSDLWQQSTLEMTLPALKSVPEWGHDQVEIMFLLVSEQP